MIFPFLLFFQSFIVGALLAPQFTLADEVAYEKAYFKYTYHDADGTLCGGQKTVNNFSICGCTFPDGKKVMTHYSRGTEYLRQYNCNGDLVIVLNTGRTATCYACKDTDQHVCGAYEDPANTANTFGDFCENNGEKAVDGESCAYINEGPMVDVRTQAMIDDLCCNDSGGDGTVDCNDDCPENPNPIVVLCIDQDKSMGLAPSC